MSTRKQQSGHSNSEEMEGGHFLMPRCQNGGPFRSQAIVLFKDKDYEDTIRDKLKRMEAREDIASFRFHFLTIFTNEPTLVTKIMNKILANDFEVSHPKIAKFMQKKSFAYLINFDPNFGEVINEHAILTEMVKSGQISEEEMDDSLEDAVNRIQARVDSGTTSQDLSAVSSLSTSPPHRLGSDRAIKKLMHTIVSRVMTAGGASVNDFKPEPYQPRPIVGKYKDGKPFVALIVKVVPRESYEKAFGDVLAKMEAYPDLESYHYYFLNIFTCKPDVVNDLLPKMTQQPDFSARCPRVAAAVRSARFKYFIHSDPQVREELNHLASMKAKLEAIDRKEMTASEVAKLLKDLEFAPSQPDETQAQAPSRRCCSSCGQEVRRLLMCSGCKAAFYCSAAHQKADWRYHKAQCKKLAAANKFNSATEK